MATAKIQGNPLGSGSVTLAAPNTNSDFTLNMPAANGTLLSTATPGVPVNGPTFNVGIGGAQSISATTWTKVQLTVETFDVGSCFDTSTHRFTPNVAGYYQISGNISFNGQNSVAVIPAIYKNGTAFRRGSRSGVTTSVAAAVTLSTVVYLNGSTDFAELYVFSDGAINTEEDSQFTWMSGALVRAA